MGLYVKEAFHLTSGDNVEPGKEAEKAVKMMGPVLSGETAQPSLHRPQGLIPSTTRNKMERGSEIKKGKRNWERCLCSIRSPPGREAE